MCRPSRPSACCDNQLTNRRLSAKEARSIEVMKRSRIVNASALSPRSYSMQKLAYSDHNGTVRALAATSFSVSKQSPRQKNIGIGSE